MVLVVLLKFSHNLGARWKRYFIATSVLVVVLVSTAGCGDSLIRSTLGGGNAGLSGRIHGGQQPISGATIQLYAAGNAGDGSTSAPLIATPTVTNISGGFSIGGYTCPSSSTNVYLTATGGNPGLQSGGTNPNLSLMAALGPCGNLTSSTYISVSELSTVAAVYALAPFMKSFTAIGSGPMDSELLTDSFQTAGEMVNTGTEAIPGVGLPAGFTVLSQKLRALANVIAACVNSSGGLAGDGSACGSLFSYATPSSGIAPTDTVGALLNIANNPSAEVVPLYLLSPSTPPFQPGLTSAPSDWSLPLISLVPSPTLSPSPGTYNSLPAVTLADTNLGAQIYYTTDGSTPTTSSRLYSGAISLSAPGMVRAIAVAAGASSLSAAGTYLSRTASMTVNPGTVSLTASQTQAFAVGGMNTGVTWSLSPAIGSISSTGLYAAPATVTAPQTVLVTATSTANSAFPATATVLLVPAVSVSISPNSVSLGPSQAATFTANVSGSSNTLVVWSVSPVIGNISAAGVYTAPASIPSMQTVTVTASSVSDSTKQASASVLLTPDLGASLNAGPIIFPPGFMPSVKDYGAVGDGITDDTVAIQAALADGRTDPSVDYYGRPKALYFPPGTYLVHDTLQWIGCCLTLQGAGSSASTIRLAPNSSGFGDPLLPKPLLLSPLGNESFHQNIWDLGLSVGPNNSGATALSYISNNSGAVHNVLIRSEDGSGYSGIDLTRQYAGPLLIKNIEVQGFNVGIDLQNAEYSSTFEGITLQGQHIAGIRNINQPISIRGLQSNNAVPAITNNSGSIVLLDAMLTGGDPANSAVQTNSTFYLRNVSSSGYASTLKDTSKTTTSTTLGTIQEYLVGSPQTITGKLMDRSLNLPIQETPSYTSSSLSDWIAFVPNWYGDTSGLQGVLNSGTHTVYFPFATYFSWAEAQVTVPDSVNRIVGFSSVVNGSSAGPNGGGIRLVVTGNSSTPLVVEQFGYGLKIDHRGSRPVVLKDTAVSYTSDPGAGNLFLEDVEVGPLVMQPGQHVWARQLNDEVSATKISNPGGSLWILGLKTEQAGTVIDTSAGGNTELLGALIYPATSVPATDAAFRSTDSQVSYIYTEHVYCAGCGYGIQVNETRSGTSRSLTASPGNGFQMPLFVGYE